MQLAQVIKGLKHADLYQSKSNIEITGLALDSRKVENGYLYAALPGTQADGHAFIPQAIAKGATAILCSQKPDSVNNEITLIIVADVIAALGTICSNFFDHPDLKLALVGVTGTNGKTTIATLLHNLFENMGNTCGLISTVENRIGNRVLESTHTTPDIISLYSLLHDMAEKGCSYCFMEVSSHSIAQQRIAGLRFRGGIFSNITHDHLDYHGTFDNYLHAKKKFFDDLTENAFALTNKDDKNGLVMLQNTKAAKFKYSMHGAADFTVRVIESDFNGMQLEINGVQIWVNLVGEFNAYNLLAVYAAAFILTEGKEDLAVFISALPRVNGRFEAIGGPNRVTAIVDYAHTPDALKNVIDTINLIRKNSAKLITVVGCGGNRDKTKRPEMASIASRLSDKVILTSDNPRNENPEAILDEMEAGIEGQNYKKFLRITDRKEAIKTACMLAETGDIILVAGKGHENYQEVNGIKYPFDDKIIITESFKNRA